MMHYYFDGFIWKIHHTQNREMLVSASDSSSTSKTASWWSDESNHSGWKVLGKQLLYFAVPMTILTLASLPTWTAGHDNYVAHMYRAQELSQQGLSAEAEYEARTAFRLMKEQLPLTTKLVELKPSGARHAELAFLIYNESLYEHVVMPSLGGESPNPQRITEHRDAVRAAIEHMNLAINSGEQLSHEGRDAFDINDAQRIVSSWRRQVG